MHRLCQGRLVLKGGENLFGWDSLAFQISHTHRLCRGRLGGENLSVWDHRWSSSSPICTGCADQAGAHRGGEFELVHVRLTGLPDLPYTQAVPRQTGPSRGRELVRVGLGGLPALPYAQAVPRQAGARRGGGGGRTCPCETRWPSSSPI